MRPALPTYQNQINTPQKKKERQLQANISQEHRGKNPQQNISKPNSTIHLKKSFTMVKWDLFQGGSMFTNQSM